jgi:hypothetical protein
MIHEEHNKNLTLPQMCQVSHSLTTSLFGSTWEQLQEGSQDVPR